MIKVKLKSCIKTYSGYAFSSKDFCDEGVQVIKIGNLFGNKLSLERSPAFVDEGFLFSHHEYIARQGDVLISLTGTLGKKDYGYAVAIEKNSKFLVNQRVLKICAKDNIDQEYLLFLLQSECFLNELYSLANGTKQANISASDILNIVVNIPSIELQRSISKLLVRETSVIDNAIKSYTQKLTLLEEYKTALIHNAVTKGLGANGCRILDGTPADQMKWKDSGIEWIGEIPDEWGLEKLLNHAYFVKGISLNREELNGDSGIRYLRSSDIFEKSSIKKDRLFSSENNTLVLKQDNEFVFCFDGFNTVAGDGTVGLATRYGGRGYIDSHLCLIYPKSMKLRKKFSEYWLAGDYFRNFCVKNEKGSISYSAYHAKGNLKIALPDINEQKEIEIYLDSLDIKLSKVKLAVNKKIALLQEYKKSLINEAVSGELNV